MSVKDCGAVRSPAIVEAQANHLKLYPNCVSCRPETNLKYGRQAHHIVPFHYCIAVGREPAARDPRNFITLCETEKDDPADNHHLLVGHLGDFSEGNLNVVHDARLVYYGLDKTTIKNSRVYLEQVKNYRLKPLDQMTDQNKEILVKLIDRWFPQDDPAHVPDFILTDEEIKGLE